MRTNSIGIFLFAAAAAVATSSVADSRHYKHDYHRQHGAEGNPPVMACEDILTEFSFPATTITESSFAVAGEECDRRGNCTGVPDHCIVKGKMNERIGPIDGKPYAIGFEMRLPTDWSGRYFYQANGGVDGNIAAAYGNILGGGPTSNGLLKGFAVISSDAGHPTRSADFGVDPQARLDYGYNAVAELTPMAKQLIKTYFGKKPDTSYIVGTSNGGRHAMVAASRYYKDYDGVLAGSPGFNLPKAAVAQLWGVQQYATIADHDAVSGRPDIWSSFTLEDTALVAQHIIAKCDLLDGAADQWVGDPVGCQAVFDIDVDIPTCEDPGASGCLTYGQKAVLAQVHTGAMDSLGEALYSDFLWDPGILSSGWRTWKFGNSTTNRDPVAVGYIFTTPPHYPSVVEQYGTSLLDYALNWNGTGFDVDRDAPKIYATDDTYQEAAMSFMTPPDPLMKKFRKHRGKMIVVHGSADPVFSVADTIDWYETLQARHRKHTDDFARLFMVPGMGHSRGGPATDQYDLVDALINWVERGIEPDQIIATARGGENSEIPASWSPQRTRPLCAYPATPRYSGSGEVEDASNWSCVRR